MKKALVLLLALSLLLCLSGVRAEVAPSPYTILLKLLDSRSFTLTAAVEEADLEEADAIPFETASLTLRLDEDGAILCEGVLNGETVLTARMTDVGFAYDCAMIAGDPQSWTWEEMPPSASLKETADGFSLSLRLNGVDHEHITISIDLSGSYPEGYEGEFGYTLMKGSGEIYGLWDVFSAEDGETSSELIISLVHETILTAEGTEEITDSGDGSITVIRREACDVTLDDNEIGTVTLVRQVTIE